VPRSGGVLAWEQVLQATPFAPIDIHTPKLRLAQAPPRRCLGGARCWILFNLGVLEASVFLADLCFYMGFVWVIYVVDAALFDLV